MKNNLIICGVALCVATFIASCGSKTATTTDFEDNIDAAIDSTSMAEDLNKSKTILYTLPSPIEMASLIKESNVKYDEDMLNKLSMADKYSSNLKMAINLGIYSSDMSFASMFNQSQKTVEYFSTIQGLTSRLGIVKLIDEATIKRLEENGTSKDDILNVISDVYMDVNQYLTENNRKNIAVMVLTGGWVEGLYIALNLTNGKPNQELIERIVAQKLALSTVLSIIDQNNPNDADEDLNYLKNKILEIKMFFDEVRVEPLGQVTATTNAQAKMTTIKANCANDISDDVLNMLKEKVTEVRNEFIN